ncbi:hypothetical protein PRIC2_011084 [Phytophthora ramorum]|uniref:Serine/threonine-protein kinase phg2 n=1 Tax=Phytophthora ramorum TaxID=164328 RepID=UPI0030A650DE|nr:Serine/threonine-protein kinase phg2 [Phytophthora ramorum]
MGTTPSGGYRVVTLALGCTLLLNVASADCAAGSSTLTTEGCSACGDFDLCLGFTSVDECSGSGCETDGDCTYQCMGVHPNLSTLVVLIEFGGYKSSKEVAAGGYSDQDLAGYSDLTDQWPSASNDDVTAVGTIDLSSAVTTFIMSGGSTDVEYPQGKVASVTLTSDFISASAVTNVVLQNLDLQSEASSLPSYLPSSVEQIDLANTLLSSFPAELGDFTSLRQLLLDSNYITTVDSLNVIDSIVTLSIESNSLTTFTGVFSNLEYLYLGANNLTSIPTAIFSHFNLKTLNLTGNSFTSRSFTQDQAEFLSNLETLGLSSSDFTIGLECDDMEQVVVHDVTVCLSDGVAASSNRVSASSSAGVDGSEEQTTSSTSSSSSISMIVGIICGVSACVIAAILFVCYRRKKKVIGQSKVSSTAEDHSPASNQQRQPYGGLRTSTGVPIGIPMTDSGVAMGIQTSAPESEASTGRPMTAEGASTYPLTSLGAPPTKKATPFLSVWNDPELLSLQVRVEDVEDVKQLGSGAFATVWLVRYRKSQMLASKRLRSERRTKKHTSSFVEEIKLLANFDHPNLVKLIGAAWTIESDLQALLEYMDGGDLRQYLGDASTAFGWSFMKFDIAIGIIEALVYLHSFVPPLVHRDLKSKNVMLSADFRAKLSDFGTSRFRSVENTMTAGVGTGRWLAPEVIRGDTDYGCSADIYSFGALLTELDTNQIPYSNARGSNGKILSDMTILHRVATGKLHPQVRSSCGASMRDLVNRCLIEDPTKRPAATVIAYELRGIQKEMATSLEYAESE